MELEHSAEPEADLVDYADYLDMFGLVCVEDLGDWVDSDDWDNVVH